MAFSGQDVDPTKLPTALKTLSGVNLSDPTLCRELYPVLEKNMRVVDFWLNQTVFPHESKQFSQKLVASAWDLCRRDAHPITGFSGTNGCKLLLPLSIEQHDLPELEGTNAAVLQNILRPENHEYKPLPQCVLGREILESVSGLKGMPVRVLLDVGALMLELDNEQTAASWLKETSPEDVDAAIYFDRTQVLVSLDRQGRITPFRLSPFKHRLDRCVVFLDDEHTRGTDMKFPPGTKALVTLGKGVTQDRLVQVRKTPSWPRSWANFSLF